jgi:hypothetical protein
VITRKHLTRTAPRPSPSPFGYRKALRAVTKAIEKKDSRGHRYCVGEQGEGIVPCGDAQQPAQDQGAAPRQAQPQPQQPDPAKQAVLDNVPDVGEPIPEGKQEVAKKVGDKVGARVKSALVKVAKAGRAVAGAPAEAGRRVAEGLRRVTEAAVEKINQARGKNDGDKGHIDPVDAFLGLITKPFSTIADWFGATSEGQADDAVNQEAERQTGVSGAGGIMKVMLAAAAWAISSLRKGAKEVGMAPPTQEEQPETPDAEAEQPKPGGMYTAENIGDGPLPRGPDRDEDEEDNPPTFGPMWPFKSLSFRSPFRHRVKAFRLSQSGKTCWDDSAGKGKLKKVAMSRCKGEQAQPTPVQSSGASQAQGTDKVTRKQTVDTEQAVSKIAADYEAVKDSSAEKIAADLSVLDAMTRPQLMTAAQAIGIALGGRTSNESIRNTIRHRFTSRLGASQRAAIVDRDVTLRRPAKNKPAARPKPEKKPEKLDAVAVHKAVMMMFTGEAPFDEGRAGELLDMLKGKPKMLRLLAAQLGMKNTQGSQAGLRSAVLGVLSDVIGEREAQKQHGRTNPKFKHVDEQIAPLQAAIQGDEVAFGAYLDEAVMSGTLTEAESERARGRAEWAGHAQVAADIAADVAVKILSEMPDEVTRSYRDFVRDFDQHTDSPFRHDYLELWLRSHQSRIHRGRGHTMDWTDPRQYVLGKLIESMGYAVAWDGNGAPDRLDDGDRLAKLGITRSDLPPGYRDAQVRVGGVPLAYNVTTPTRLHTAVSPNREAFRKVFVRLQQMNWMHDGQNHAAARVADKLREDMPDLTMAEIWGALAYANQEGMLQFPLAHQDHTDTLRPAEGQRSDSGHLWQHGRVALVHFDGREWDGFGEMPEQDG